MKAISPPAPQTFGDLLRTLRKTRNIGLVELATTTGFDPGLLSRIETGKRLPPESGGLARLAKALDLAEDSDAFRELLHAATRARAGYGALGSDVLVHFATIAGKSPELMPTPALTFCSTLGELVGKAVERAIADQALAIVVTSESGEIHRFELLRNAGKDQKRS